MVDNDIVLIRNEIAFAGDRRREPLQCVALGLGKRLDDIPRIERVALGP